jgi:hypothetical protein
MPRLVSEITEILTGLGSLGFSSVEEALQRRPPELVGVDEGTWQRILDAWSTGNRASFHDAFTNGAAFLHATDGLRERRPNIVEWRGRSRRVGDDTVPADLRIDHVYLVSCKYLSRILVNASPANLFERRLAGAEGTRDEDWFALTAPREYQALYQQVLRDHAPSGRWPQRVTDLSKIQRRELRSLIPRDWSPECARRYAALCAAVADASARRWAEQLTTHAHRRSMLWRMLRIGSAPYFVLGTGGPVPLRLRVLTPWDWDRHYELVRFEVASQPGGQARVRWEACVADREAGRRSEVRGHVEIRWSHGRFSGSPEAKVYLDTPHGQVPGYVGLR